MVAISPKFSLRRRALLGLLGALAAGALMALGRPQPTRAAPELTVYASPIQAGCYLATRSTCKIHVDPFTIFHSGGSRLVGFQLRANGSLIYDFKTDVSNPPAGNYSPSRVKLDFAASCGQTYTINLLGRDSSSEGYINLGQVENVVCPQGVNENFLPLIVR